MKTGMSLTEDERWKMRIECFWKRKEKQERARKIRYRSKHPKQPRPEITEEVKKARLEKEKQNSKAHYLKSKENGQRRAYIEENRVRIREYTREYYAKRRAKDSGYRVLNSLRTRLRIALKSQGAVKISTTMSLVGCSLSDLRSWLESKFQEGMTWENHGILGWHIDHIKPCALFDFSDLNAQQECFHYTNLQPLWAEENWLKGNKFTEAERTKFRAAQNKS